MKATQGILKAVVALIGVSLLLSGGLCVIGGVVDWGAYAAPFIGVGLIGVAIGWPLMRWGMRSEPPDAE